MPVQDCPIYDPKRHRCVEVALLPKRNVTSHRPPRVLAFSNEQVYTKLDAYNFAFLSILAYQDPMENKVFFNSLSVGDRPLLRPDPEDFAERESYSPILTHTKPGNEVMDKCWLSISTKLMGTQALFAIRESELIIACRGTELAPNLHEVLETDILTDVDAKRVPAPSYLSGDWRALLHHGFLESFEQVREELETFLEKHKRIKFNSVKVCGHSQGGALAALCAVYFARKKGMKVLLYTFGQPRVGNLWFCKEADSLSNLVAFRLDHLGDPVPHVPPPWSGPLLDFLPGAGSLLAPMGLEIRPNRIFHKDFDAIQALTSTVLHVDKSFYAHFGHHVPLARSDKGVPGVVVNGAEEITLTTLYLTPEEEEMQTGSAPNQISHHSMFEYTEIVQGDLLRFLGFLYENRDLRNGATYEFNQRQVQLVELRKELERRRALWRPNARGTPPTQLLTRTIQEIEWLEAAFERSWNCGNGPSKDIIWFSIWGNHKDNTDLLQELRLQWELRVRTAEERIQDVADQHRVDLPTIDKVKTLMRQVKARKMEVPDLAQKVGLSEW